MFLATIWDTTTTSSIVSWWNGVLSPSLRKVNPYWRPLRVRSLFYSPFDWTSKHLKCVIIYLCLILLSGQMSNRFDGLILSKAFWPSESFTISEDFHFNVVNVGLDLIGDVPTIVVHNSIIVTLKIFLLTLIMSFPTSSGFTGWESYRVSLLIIYITNFYFITNFFSLTLLTRFHSRKLPQILLSSTFW